MRSMSWIGGSSTTSTSPDRKAAVRVALLAIGMATYSVTLPSVLPHQFGNRSSTVLTSGSRLRSMNGPVPLVWRAVALSCCCAAFCGVMARFASHHALLMMPMTVSLSTRIGSGSLVMTSTVSGSTASTRTTLST